MSCISHRGKGFSETSFDKADPIDDALAQEVEDLRNVLGLPGIGAMLGERGVADHGDGEADPMGLARQRLGARRPPLDHNALGPRRGKSGGELPGGRREIGQFHDGCAKGMGGGSNTPPLGMAELYDAGTFRDQSVGKLDGWLFPDASPHPTHDRRWWSPLD